jgi:hypothetical protein
MQAMVSIRYWGIRRYLVAAVAGGIWLTVSGVPTDLMDTPLFVRMTPVVWWNYPFWMVGAVLVGLLAATYVAEPGVGRAGSSQEKNVAGGGLISVLAIGCPVCNKLVVLALGYGGATTYFAPAQPILGFLSVGILLYALRLRLRSEGTCPTGPPDTPILERESG